MITALMDTKQGMDFLQGVEGQLGAQQVPGGDQQQVQDIISENEVRHKGIILVINDIELVASYTISMMCPYRQSCRCG